jgi:hypothetical protein
VNAIMTLRAFGWLYELNSIIYIIYNIYFTKIPASLSMSDIYIIYEVVLV